MRPTINILRSSVRKVCQLTGECDRQLKSAAFNQTESKFGLFGTDLGSSFEHEGRLWFLFGDTWPGPGPTDALDSVAWTIATQPEPGIPLEFMNDNCRYRSPRLFGTDGSALSTGGFEVPVAGFSNNGQMYIFYSTDHFVEACGDGGLDVYWIGQDNAPATTWANPIVNGSNWHPVSSIAGLSGVNSPLATIVRFDSAVDIFWIGADAAIATNWSNPTVDNSSWHTPFPISPPGASRANSPLSAVTRLEGALDVFWIGPDGAIGSNWANPKVDSGKWHTSFPISPPGASRANSPLSAVTRLEGALDVFWIGHDGAIGSNWANPKVDNGNWHAPFPITPPGVSRADSPLSAITRLEGALDVFWIGPDGAIGSNWANPKVDNGNWHTPFPITPPGAARANSPLAVVTRLEGALDVFWIGPDGAIATTWANPKVDSGNWHVPFPITPPGASRENSPLAAITRFEGALDVFWIGPDGATATTWANPKIANGNWHAPFPITPAGAARAVSSIVAITRPGGHPPQDLMGRTVLAAANNNDPTDLHVQYDFSIYRQGGKFLNVACVIAPNGSPGLPFQGPALLGWGSGRYRESNVYLCCAPLNEVGQQSAWRFFIGPGPFANPQWGSDQRTAAELFFQPQVGELSVVLIKPLGLWLMLYNASSPRGINARVAYNPWGPWSDPVLIFDPSWPGLGYGNFMHIKDSNDGLSDPGREGEWGGEYAPYMIDRYTRAVSIDNPNARHAQIYFTLSTWNPYNVMLMTATIERASDTQ